MKNRSWIVALYLIITLAACTSGGSSSTDRTHQTDSQATAAQQSSPASTTQSEAPILAEVPEAPTPKPMGWPQFDAYFKQLQVVYDYVLADSVPLDESKKLVELANKLAKDKSKEHDNSAPLRQMLAEQVTRFMERSGVLELEQRLEPFPQVLLGTREVVQTGTLDQIKGYPEKLEAMRVNVENKLMQIRFKRQ